MTERKMAQQHRGAWVTPCWLDGVHHTREARRRPELHASITAPWRLGCNQSPVEASRPVLPRWSPSPTPCPPGSPGRPSRLIGSRVFRRSLTETGSRSAGAESPFGLRGRDLYLPAGAPRSSVEGGSDTRWYASEGMPRRPGPSPARGSCSADYRLGRLPKCCASFLRGILGWRRRPSDSRSRW
jgi:hypothetical protein